MRWGRFGHGPQKVLAGGVCDRAGELARLAAGAKFRANEEPLHRQPPVNATGGRRHVKNDAPRKAGDALGDTAHSTVGARLSERSIAPCRGTVDRENVV